MADLSDAQLNDALAQIFAGQMDLYAKGAGVGALNLLGLGNTAQSAPAPTDDKGTRMTTPYDEELASTIPSIEYETALMFAERANVSIAAAHGMLGSASGKSELRTLIQAADNRKDDERRKAREANADPHAEKRAALEALRTSYGEIEKRISELPDTPKPAKRELTEAEAFRARIEKTVRENF